MTSLLKKIIAIFLSSCLHFSSYCQESQMQEGYELLDAGQYSEAELFFEKVLLLDSENKTANICYNRALGLGGGSHLALTNFLVLEQKFIGDKEILYNIAEAYMWVDNFDAAANIYEQLIGKEPESFLAHYGYANAQAAMFSMEVARTHITIAIKLKPDDEQAKLSLLNILLSSAHQAYTRGRMKVAKGYLTELSVIAPEDARYLALLSQVRSGASTWINLGAVTTSDSGNNQSVIYSGEISAMLVDKHRMGISVYRNQLSREDIAQAEEQTLWISDTYQISRILKLTGGLGAFATSFEDEGSSGYFKRLILEGHWGRALYTNFTYDNRLKNYSYELLESSVVENNYSFAFNYLKGNKLGLYAMASYGRQSDSNERKGGFASLYYKVNIMPRLKFGVNYNIMSYEQRDLIYFSPDRYSAYELFFRLDNSEGKSRLKYLVDVAAGEQQINNRDAKFNYRGELSLGYEFTNSWNLSFAYFYNSTANAVATENYSFSRATLQLRHIIHNDR